MVSFKDILGKYKSELIYSCYYVAEKDMRAIWERRLLDYCLPARLKVDISAVSLEGKSSDLEAKMIDEPGNPEIKRLFSLVGGLLSKHHAKQMLFYTIKVSADRNRCRELNVENIETMRKDIEISLKASEYAWMEPLAID